MHRMRRLVAMVGLAVLGTTLWCGSASAALIKPNAQRVYPDVAADINGVISYAYNPATETGNFHLTNTPYLLAAGATSAEEFAILPNANDGIRMQVVNVALDKTGAIIDSSPTNSYALYGTMKVNGTDYTGLLLSGKPTAFGAQDLSGVGIQDSDLFDLKIKITGGALADYFGEQAYMRVAPELGSTFTGAFDTDFTAHKATSNTRRDGPAQPFPIPEPSTLLIVLAGGFGLWHRNRRRPLSR
jgi:hypothetical protein